MDSWLHDELRSLFPSLKGLSAIDCGCGTGENSVGLAQQGAKVFAFDKNQKKIFLLQMKAKTAGVKIRAAVSTMQDFKSRQQYDIVICTYVLHFLPDDEAEDAARKIIDLIAPGGVLVFADLEDEYPVPDNCLAILKKPLTNMKEERLTLEDTPHPGADFFHSHNIYRLVGRRPL